MAERALSQLIPKSRPSPSQTCRKFLPNPVRDLVSIRFLRGPNRALAWALWSRQARPPPETVVHFNVSEHPTASGRTEQIVDASRNDPAPSSLLRDRDRIYGHPFRQRVRGMGIGEVRTPPSSPWQTPFAERLIGSTRRECLDHVLVLGERHLGRIMTQYFAYYRRARPHLSLEQDAPDERPIE